MNREEIKTEIEEWSNVTPDHTTLLADVSMIAWQALAYSLSEQDRARLAYAARVAGTRSQVPRTVLRKLINLLAREHGYAPGDLVRRAAGLAAPKPQEARQ